MGSMFSSQIRFGIFLMKLYINKLSGRFGFSSTLAMHEWVNLLLFTVNCENQTTSTTGRLHRVTVSHAVPIWNNKERGSTWRHARKNYRYISTILYFLQMTQVTKNKNKTCNIYLILCLQNFIDRKLTNKVARDYKIR